MEQPEESICANQLRPEIAASWRRARMLGIDPGQSPSAPPSQDNRPSAHRLLKAALPVLEDLMPQLDRSALVLADRTSRIAWYGTVDRSLDKNLGDICTYPGRVLAEERVGTNGVGTVAETRRPVVIAGSEHYLDCMQEFTCAGVPLRDQLTGRFEGILDITCRNRYTSDTLLPFLVWIARKIEERLFDACAISKRALLDAFVRLCSTPACAVASVSDDMLITNSQAGQLLEPADHALIWAWAQTAVRGRRTVTEELTLSSGAEVRARCTPVDVGGKIAGVTVTMSPRQLQDDRVLSERADVEVATGGSWRRLNDKASRAAQRHRNVVLCGEAGTGKATLAVAMHAAAGGKGPVIRLDSARIDSVEPFRDALRNRAATVCLFHVDQIDPAVARDAVPLVMSANSLVIMTKDVAEPPSAEAARLIGTADVEIVVPPLRERKDDIPALTRVLLAELNGPTNPPRVGSDVLTALMAEDWCGNVTELRRVLAAALLSSQNGSLRLQDLPRGYGSTRETFRPLGRLRLIEREAIVQALERSGWNYDSAARYLGISRATIYRRVKQMGIQRPVVIS